MKPAPFHGNVSFNAHHSPMGAYCTFTCGHFGTRGGLAAQLGKPGGQDIFAGVKLGGRYDKAPMRSLPFFDGARALIQEGALSYTLDKPDGQMDALSAYGAADIARHYGWATDAWQTADCTFSLLTPFGQIPDPAQATADQLRAALLPAVVGELLIDNRQGAQTKTGFLALNFNEGGARILDQGLAGPRVGFALRANYGVAAHAVDVTEGVAKPAESPAFNIMRWSVQQGLEDGSNPVHLLGSHPGVAVEVPPGKCVALRLALGSYLEGIVTTRLEGRYLYTRHYSGLIDVLNAALDRFEDLRSRAEALDGRLRSSGLNADQQFLIAHATRSYYGNTELLEVDGEPYWIVNEGEYCMMNTLDLAVDQMFWELEHNPWVVRNVLDNFALRYSYRDQIKVPPAPPASTIKAEASETQSEIQKSKSENPLAPGGISFTHDQGVHNQFSPAGQSSYELKDLAGCFSYMTQEQLCNWILMAASYVATTHDRAWLGRNGAIIRECLASMLQRDHPDEMARRGWMRCDSALTGSGAEITSYDSLDQSLAQARSNLYLVSKSWAAYLGLEALLALDGGDELAAASHQAAERLESSLLQRRSDVTAVLPAIVDGRAKAILARILPAMEGLIYPAYWCQAFGPHRAAARRPVFVENHVDEAGSPFEGLVRALRAHAAALLADPQRRNHFADGGIRLSSTSENSWLSKIALVQHVARTLFNLDENGGSRVASQVPPQGVHDAAGWEKADAAHVKWLTEGESGYWAASDQMISGTAKGSRYYPRLITTALWLTGRLPPA